MGRYLKNSLQGVVVVLVIITAWSVTRPQSSSGFLEGYYETYDGDTVYELRNGRFQNFSPSSDARGKKYPMFTGRYEISGTRISITYEKVGSDLVDIRTVQKLFDKHPESRPPDGQVVYFRTVSEVPVLLTKEALDDLNAGKKLPYQYSQLFVFTTNPERRGLVGWIGFLKRHPKFAAAFNNSLEVSWWAYQRWRMRDVVERRHPDLYNSLPDWVKRL